MPERSVARNFLTLGSGEVVARVLAFVSSLYLARVLGAEAYGVIGFALAVLLYFGSLADGGLDLVGMREVAHDPGEAARIAGPLIAFRLATSSLLAVLLAAAAIAWLPQRDGLALALFAPTLITIGASTRWVHLGLERSRYPSVARVLGEGLGFVMILLLVSDPDDYLRVPFVHLVSGSLTAMLLAWWLRAYRVHFALHWNWSLVRPLLARSYRLVLASLLGLLVFNSDLIMLRAFRDAPTAGFYAAAYTPISLAISLGLAYRMSLLPTFARMGAAGAQRKVYETALAHVFAAVVPAAIGGWILAPLAIELIFGKEYAPAAPVLQVLIWAIPFAQLREPPTAALAAHRREYRMLHGNAVGTALSICMNLVLIPRYGMMGAAASTVVTEGARTILAFVFAHEAGFQLAALRRFWRVAVAGVVMAALLFALRDNGFWLAAIGGSLGYLMTLALLGAIRFREGELPELTV